MIICEIKQLKQVPSSTTPMIGGGSYRAPVQATVSFFNPPRIYALLRLLCSLSSIRKGAFIYIPDHQAVTNMFYTDKHQRQRAS
ncbi:hypothetical protein OUZ56_005868 [Daphnia magna]|uniref:Uncharacterized protein n=1 Tax=Daphnia magna TaxID=35525 RepID=A0ABQ9YTZ4_9CRUS|nr:hypothetical protein OUZ56_005868 [Daphnia magna]